MLSWFPHQIPASRVHRTALGRTEEIMRAVCADSGAGLAEFNSETSHVHLLVTCSPQAALSG